MEKTYAIDAFAYWCEEHATMVLGVELEDGDEKTLAEIQPAKKPAFACKPDSEEWSDRDNAEYGEWYDLALEEAHKRGYVLDGDEQ